MKKLDRNTMVIAGGGGGGGGDPCNYNTQSIWPTIPEQKQGKPTPPQCGVETRDFVDHEESE